jgi:curved DNA-binding protein CbpA
VRIPLDYYRILGVPIQATEGQLSQAYHDRALQMPRREYSDVAITARKQLLDEAYNLLNDPERRSQYDADLLAFSQKSGQRTQVELPLSQPKGTEGSDKDSQHHTIEIDPEKFVGALLILQELGEYDLVLKLGQPYLDNRNSISLDKGRLGNPQMVRADIILSIALSYLELSREQWQQGQYENASGSGNKGQELLLKEGLFPNIRGEIQSDLYKLRPYQILELLSADKTNKIKRHNGIQLLKEMLQERGGIDGTGDDQSGLNLDDFLRFIQQLRSYLTVEEQQELFESEARRPSAVATYLAVYALLAGGFATRQPSLINRAQNLLMRLSQRQDVYLEQAVCALLLGRTEQASQALELSQERETIEFIRSNSQGAPDLLPGLCLYAEKWLKTEVFNHFKDLANHSVALKEYFADPQVQTYLEQLPESPLQNQWSILDTPEMERLKMSQGLVSTTDNPKEMSIRYSSVSEKNSQSRQENTDHSPLATPPTASMIQDSPPCRRGTSRVEDESALTNVPNETHLTVKTPHKEKKSAQLSRKQKRLLLLGGGFVIGVGAVLLIVKGVQALWNQLTMPTLEGEQLAIELVNPPVEIPPPDAQMTAPGGILNQDVATQVIQRWLNAKSKAFGQDHQVDQLKTILVDPVLNQWVNRANVLKRSNAFWRYQHTVTVRNVKTDPQKPDQAVVDAAVREIAQYYQGGQLNSRQSYDQNLLVRYEIIRKGDQWFIKGIDVIN